MAEFILDTSGAVHGTGEPTWYSPQGGPWVCYWDGLDAFAQGYARGVFATLGETVKGAVYAYRNGGKLRFDWLAPETLAAIVMDCVAFQRAWSLADDGEQGWRFWKLRQAGANSDFPPRIVYLDDASKVRFA